MIARTILPVILLLLVGCSSQPPASDLPNFAAVAPSIYRGGQPTDQGWVYLQNLGVTNVVKLDEESEGSDAQAVKLGMTIHSYPLSFTEQFFFLGETTKVWNAVSAIQSNTYIHCRHGQDRTGLIVACWRTKNGMSKQDAEQEMLTHGFHKDLFGLWDSWKDYLAPQK